MTRSWSKRLTTLIPGFLRRRRPADPQPELSSGPTLRFHIGYLDDVENRELYKKGGFHPTRIGDTFSQGRYRVFHKLGYGGFATVWCARDQQTNTNVALKIIVAEGDSDNELEIHHYIRESGSDHPGKAYIVHALDHFWLEGPNGRHLCLVLPVLGPSVSQVLRISESRRLDGQTARLIALQATQALASLHSIGLGHGDFRPSNLLFQVKGMSEWSEEDLTSRLGEIDDEIVRYRDATPANEAGVPRTIISPSEYPGLVPEFLEKCVYLVDLGEAFHLDAPTSKGLGTPASYCAPECHFDRAATTKTDIWALACTIFEIRAGYSLFETFMGAFEDEVVQQIVVMLGKLPEPWWSKWTFRDAFWDQDGKPLDGETPERTTLEDDLKEIGVDDANQGSSANSSGALSQEEVEDLADLLGQMLRYDPSERIDVHVVLQHRWFTKDY
ncbi:protein kinase domain-containing protein [Sarocladium implicatum]|nr:protein kinase domain-containing protein [Sarocladium implicatum]